MTKKALPPPAIFSLEWWAQTKLTSVHATEESEALGSWLSSGLLPETPEARAALWDEWVQREFRITAEQNAKKDLQNASETADFMATLPQLNTRRNARNYITLVAVGFQRGLLTALEAKTMLYMAQLALAAAPPPTPRASRAANAKRGFGQ